MWSESASVRAKDEGLMALPDSSCLRLSHQARSSSYMIQHVGQNSILRTQAKMSVLYPAIYDGKCIVRRVADRPEWQR